MRISTIRAHFLLTVFFSFLSVIPFGYAEPGEKRAPWDLDENYSGSYPDAFRKLKWDVPILMRQTIINLSGTLGLPYKEGWRYPLRVRFADSVPLPAENLFACVVLYQDRDGIRQDLFINVKAHEKNKFDFEKMLAHELVHAMMNDAMGALASSLLPIWLHEGLALYGAGQGEKVVRSYVYQHSGFAKSKLINGLDGPHGPLDYAEDYLAIKYIVKAHGPNALPFFVREMVSRGGDVRGAYEYVCRENWERFLLKAAEFSREEIKEIGPAKRGKYEKPY